MADRPQSRFCPLSLALDVLGDRWSLHVVRALFPGPQTRESLCTALAPLDDADLDATLRGLIDAEVIRVGQAGDHDSVFELTDRGGMLGPIVQELIRWGLGDLLLTTRAARDPELFDQSGPVANLADPKDETYAWTIDGRTFALEVAGSTLIRTLGPPPDPVVTLETSSETHEALVFGKISFPEALMRGELRLSGQPEAIRRMFHVCGFPPELLGAFAPDRISPEVSP
jgi:DNA-binding HxlR family transcriptional regulator